MPGIVLGTFYVRYFITVLQQLCILPGDKPEAQGTCPGSGDQEVVGRGVFCIFLEDGTYLGLRLHTAGDCEILAPPLFPWCLVEGITGQIMSPALSFSMAVPGKHLVEYHFLSFYVPFNFH